MHHMAVLRWAQKPVFELKVDGDTTHYSKKSCPQSDMINNMFMQAEAAENICKCAMYKS